MKSIEIRAQLRALFLTLALVAGTTLVIYAIILYVGLTRGTVAYIIPVLIAAIRWGIVPALFAAILGVFAAAFFFFPPRYSLDIRDPQEFINLGLYVFTAVVVSQLANQLKRQLELSRQREIDLRDLYSFSRRLAVAFDVVDIRSAIEDHLAAVLQRKIVLLSGSGETTAGGNRRGAAAAPAAPPAVMAVAASGNHGTASTVVDGGTGDIWLVRPVSAKSREFGVVAINLGRETKQAIEEMRVRVDAVLADAAATLDRLGVAHAINEARMRAQTDLLREALIGSVSHELRTPLASILGAATVLSAAPILQNEKKLKALVHDVRDEAERLNQDIQNLLDATRISSDGIKPHMEWADPADIINTAAERCRQRLANRHFRLDLPADLPPIHVDPVLVKQALVQILDNAVKYSAPGSRIDCRVETRNGRLVLSLTDEGAGIIPGEEDRIWDRFARGERLAATTSGSGLGLWIANAFIAANGGSIYATSGGAGKGTTVTIELPITQAAVSPMEADSDE